MNNYTAAHAAKRLIGLREQRGDKDNPLIVGMLQTFASWVNDDETAWCGAFAGFIAHLLGFSTPGPERWRALQARRWLTVGYDVSDPSAWNGDCVVVLSRGRGRQPGPEVLDAKGHVGFYDGHDDDVVWLVGGNQGNRVGRKAYPRSRILGVRRLVREPLL